MASDKKKSFVKWLEILQQESWQLELLISGFAIFLLASAYDQLTLLDYQINLLSTGSPYFSTLYLPFQVLLGAWYVLMINLVLHVMLRGLWISTIGLRYVSGEIDFDVINLSPKFDRFLKKRIVSFDLYIQQLEKLCSSVFGFTFLIIFILISGGLYLLGIIIIALSMNWLNSAVGGAWVLILVVVLMLYVFGGFVYFLDFVTLGWVKRRKKFAKIYYPIYRFFSFITLAFIYRPLYYNLIDNKYGRKVVLFLIPYICLFTLIASVSFETHAYLPEYRDHQSLENDYYDDIWDKDKPVHSASIGSKFVANGFIELFLPYNGRNDDKVIKILCPDLEPAKTGIFFFGNSDDIAEQMDAKTALDCHARRFNIYVNDSLMENLSYRFYEHIRRKNMGLLTLIDVDFLSRGEHVLKVDVLVTENQQEGDTLIFEKTDRIPFWKE